MKLQEFIHELIEEDPIKSKYTSRQRSLFYKKMQSKINSLLKEETQDQLEEKQEELEATCEQLEEKQEELEESREELEDTCEKLEEAQKELKKTRIQMEHYRKSYHALKHKQSLEANCEQLEEKEEELEESREELEDTCEQLEETKEELRKSRIQMEHYRKSYHALKHKHTVYLECVHCILNISILVYLYYCLYEWIKNSMQTSQLQIRP